MIVRLKKIDADAGIPKTCRLLRIAAASAANPMKNIDGKMMRLSATARSQCTWCDPNSV